VATSVVFALFVVAVFAVLAADEVGQRRSGARSWWRRPWRNVSIPAEGRSFRGGARIGALHGSRPLAQLWFDRDCAVIRLGWTASVAMPRWRVVRIEISSVPLSRSTAIHFVGRSGEFDTSVFGTTDAATVVPSLRAWGWPVPD
jgi:hypothetical protein